MNKKLKSKNYNIETHYSALEYTYRQLKKNFENSKDWELSGKAYRSEMKMRRSRLLCVAKRKYLFFSYHFYEWVLYWIYGRMSGFTQSMLTPITLLLIFTLLLFPIYYLYEDI